MNNYEQYPRLRRNIYLRISKGRYIYKDMRSGDCNLVDTDSFAILRMCNGENKLKEMAAAYKQMPGGRNITAEAILEKYAEILVFSEKPSKAHQLDHIDSMLSARKVNWPYHPFREETPFQLEASLTEVCNHRCSYCYQGNEHADKDHLSLNEWIDVIEQAAGLGVQEVVFTGGEPTLYPGFMEIVNNTTLHGIFPRISTNGSTLNDDLIESLHEAGAEYIHLSLPAVTSELYGKITGKEESLKKVTRAIRRLKERDFYIRVKMVLTSDNTDEVTNLLDYCAENGVDTVHLAPFIASTRTSEDYAMIPPEHSLAEVLKAADAAEQKYPEMLIAKPGLGLWEWRNEKEIVRCGGIKDSLTVINNGNITFCEALAGVDEFIIGNVRHKKLDAIWNSPIPDRYTTIKATREPCKSCEYLSGCGTGCFLFSYMAQHDPYAADPRCFKYAGHRFGK